MLLNLKSITLAALLSTTVLIANAASGSLVNVGNEKTVALMDGSKLHVYSDGKMAMENKFGHAVMMANGQAMQPVDGPTLSMKGDEVARLADELRTQNRR